MYFITPTDPGITLIGIYETQIYGFGEKDGKLCIYTKSVFDIGCWKEYCLTDITVVKCDSCETGIHVVTGLVVSQKSVTIWIAAREGELTRIFSINIGTKKFIRCIMLNEIYSQFSFHGFNLCSKCLSPIIRYIDNDSNATALVILPQRYHENDGIFQILIVIDESMYCLLRKKPESFKLALPPPSSNILVNHGAQAVFSIGERSEEEDGRIQELLIETQSSQIGINMRDDNGNEWIWHEAAFCDGLCLSRTRQEDGKSILQLYEVLFFHDNNPVNFALLDYCIVGANFPSIDSTQFFVSWRFVDKEYVSKTSTKAFNPQIQSHVIPSFIVAQTAAGIVVIPLRILSLSEAAYLSLARIPLPPATTSPLPVEQQSYFYYCIRKIRNFLGLKDNVSKKEEDVPWMSIEFIKQKTGWPTVLPLTNAPKLSMINSK